MPFYVCDSDCSFRLKQSIKMLWSYQLTWYYCGQLADRTNIRVYIFYVIISYSQQFLDSDHEQIMVGRSTFILQIGHSKEEAEYQAYSLKVSNSGIHLKKIFLKFISSQKHCHNLRTRHPTQKPLGNVSDSNQNVQFSH